MASMAQDANISLTRFDFRGCGNSAGRIRDSTLSQRIADLRAVIDYLRETFHRPHICLFGSSFGGMTSIMVSAADDDIKALAIMSTPYSIEQDLGLGEVFRNDLRQYDVLTAVEQAPPILIMHGNRDKLVSVKQAKTLFDRASEEKQLKIFDTDHSFTDEQPRKQALAITVGWCAQHFD